MDHTDRMLTVPAFQQIRCGKKITAVVIMKSKTGLKT